MQKNAERSLTKDAEGIQTSASSRASLDSGTGAASSPDVSEKTGSLRALGALNFFLADVQGGVGPFLVIFLTAILHWRPNRIGIVMAVSGVVGVLAQIPAGALIDQVRQKRLIVAVAAGLIALGSVGIALLPTFPVVIAGQSFIGVAGAVFGPAIAAITLGLVGRAALDRQIGRNQSINSVGNVANAIMVGLVGASLSGRGIFYYVAALSIATIVSVMMIRDRDIDYRVARGADSPADSANPGSASSPTANQATEPMSASEDACVEDTPESAPAQVEKCEEENEKEAQEKHHLSGVFTLLQDRRILIFSLACILFHFANAGMGPLVSELLAKGVGMREGLRFASASIIVAQVAIIPLGVLIGSRAERSKRKPLYLIPFCLLPLRALLYTFSHQPYYLVGMELLDGSAMGIFGIMQLLVTADLTRGTGRFNLAQGALSTAVGIGASSSNFVAGYIVHRYGFNAGFLAMAGIAAVALVFFAFVMPETKNTSSPEAASSSPKGVLTSV